MKKKVLTVLVVLFLLNGMFYWLRTNDKKNRTTVSYVLNNKTYHLLTALNSAQWEKGLMNYRKPVDFAGMIFLFPDKQYRSFWNKNTLMDLDIYWLNDDKVVGKSLLPSIEKSKQIVTTNSTEKVNKVIELIK